MLKNWDINLQQSEKKTLFSFFLLYTVFTILLLFVLSIIYYNFQKDLMLQESRQKLNTLANKQIVKLKYLHVNFDKYKTYPRSDKFKSAIYDNAKKEIFSTLSNKNIKINFDKIVYLENEKIYFIKEPESYYLGTNYLVLEIPDDGVWLKEVLKTIGIYGTILFVFMFMIGYILARIILSPMRNAIELLDRFIKDTTHELNTPVNIIISNIEMIDKKSLEQNLVNKIKRIDIGARTISNLYEDLTYLTLSNKIVSFDEDIDIAEVINERLLYFSLFAQSKKIDVKSSLKKDVHLRIDKKKIKKLIDNLLSNAIKYNKIKGNIDIKLETNYFEIKDSGRGIEKEKIDDMFLRYARGDTSVGGFGIGLNIVSMIAKEYGLHVEINSEHKHWTKVRVSW